MNVEIKRFSDSDEDFAKATECRKKAVWSKSYVTIMKTIPTTRRATAPR